MRESERIELLVRSLDELRSEANDAGMKATADSIARAIETLWIEWEVKLGIDGMLGRMPSEDE